MKSKEREKARHLRKSGHSVKEISDRLGVSKSSASLWVSDVLLSAAAKRRLLSRYTEGQIASQAAIRAKTAGKEAQARVKALAVLSRVPDIKEIGQLLCSLVYWCEGAKIYAGKGQFSFTNSDPALVASFLRLLRKGFSVDETKFRVCVHIHGYHHEGTQLKFWSKVTNIPVEQFMRSYRKKESRTTIRSGYQGCVSVRYYDAVLHRDILAIASEFFRTKGL